MKDNIPWEIILRILDNSNDPEQVEKLNKWIKDNPENEKLYLKIKEAWLESGKIPINFSPGAKQALVEIKKKMGLKKQRFLKTNFIRLAAAAAIALILGISSLYYFSEYAGQKNLITSAAQSNIILSDGSHVWLNKNSKLTYPRIFSGNTREVNLMGEAYFEIAKNPGKPFIIKANGSETKVLGTQFNVRSYPGESTVSIVVNEGKVAFSDISNKGTVVLVKGDKALLSVESHELTKLKNDDLNFQSWRTNEYVFENQPVGLVIKTIAENNNAIYEFKDNSLKEVLINTSLKKKSLQEMLNIIAVTIDANIELTPENKILISNKAE